MCKAEIKSLLPLILGVDQVLFLFLSCHCVPLSIADPVPPDVESLDKIHQDNIETGYSQEDAVTSLVKWLVVIPVDVGGDDVSGLHKHIVQSCRNSPGPHRVTIPRVPGYQNGVAVRIREERGENSIANPRRCRCREHHQSKHPWEDPDIGEGGYDRPFLKSPGDPSDEQKIKSKHYLRRDDEQVCLEHREAELSQDKRQVVLRRTRRDVSSESDNIKRPLLPVLDSLP